MSTLYDLLYLLAVGLGWPFLLYRRLKRGPSGVPLSELMGRVPSRPVSARCVWIHAVSLGEVNATRTLVTELRTRSPDTVVVVSATTRTGLARARQIYPNLVTFRFPLDFSFAIRRVLTKIRPSIIVLMELEVWPNLVEVAEQEQIPVIIANGRVTEEKSMRRFRQPVLRHVARRMFRKLRWVGVQDERYAQRFVELGVPAERVTVTGSVKYDAADIADRLDGQDALAQAMGLDPDKPVWVCGSTGPGEEAQILVAYEQILAHVKDLQLAIIPRKPERFDEVAALIVERGYACLRRSTGAPVVPQGVVEPRPVALGDTMGELRMFYALATVVFVGRTLVPMGGSDVMEVAGLAKPLIVGPHTENFAEAVNLLASEGGCRQISSAEALTGAVLDLLRHPQRAAKMGQAARAAIVSRRGATELTVDEILDRVGAY
jgi:3-deoxy-D-manno-octulosonic-acid transferase